MSKKFVAVILSAIMCVMAIMPAYAATTQYKQIEGVSLSLSYQDFMAGSTTDESSVTVTINEPNAPYSIDNTAMSVPSSGWNVGDVPNLRVTLTVNDEDTYRFAYSASRPTGINVNGGEPHYGELKQSGKKVYYEIHLTEVVEDTDNRWEDERDWSNGTNDTSANGGPGMVGAQGAWLQDPGTKRWWFSKSDGTRPVNCWLQIASVWYFFDAAGYRVDNSWIQWKGKWYYLGNDGGMYVNRYTPDNYWVDANGVWDGKAKKQ